jgi:hypothetical protein
MVIVLNILSNARETNTGRGRTKLHIGGGETSQADVLAWGQATLQGHCAAEQAPQSSSCL